MIVAIIIESAKKDACDSDFMDFKNSFFSVLKRQKKMIK